MAVLTIPSFNEEAGQGLRAAIEAINAAGAKALVLDLRNNGGGRDALGKQLFAHLAAAPFRYYKRLTVRAQPRHEAFAQLRDRLASIPAAADGLREAPSPNLGLQQPEAVRFSGPVVALVNGGSFSATSEFAAVAQTGGRVRFVGEETGGGFCDNNSGMSFPVTLPKSRVRLTIPLVHYEMEVPCDGRRRGVIPETVVAPTIADIIAGTDRQMAAALDAAQRGGR